MNEAVSERFSLLEADLRQRREQILRRHAQNKKKGLVATMNVLEMELLDRFQPQQEPYQEGDLDADGKPKVVLHLHNQDPVPEKWRQ